MTPFVVKKCLFDMPVHLTIKPFVEFAPVQFDQVCAYLIIPDGSSLVGDMHLMGLGICPSNGDMEIPLHFYSYGADKLEGALQSATQTHDVKNLLTVLRGTKKPLQ